LRQTSLHSHFKYVYSLQVSISLPVQSDSRVIQKLPGESWRSSLRNASALGELLWV